MLLVVGSLVPEADLLCGLISSSFYRAAGIVRVDCEKATLRLIFKACSCGSSDHCEDFQSLMDKMLRKNSEYCHISLSVEGAP